VWMSVALSLDDARDKVRWAKHHLDELRPQIEAFEQRDNHTISGQIDADAGVYRFFVQGLEPIDPDWGLRIGDCLNNARSALDFLMVRLISRVLGTDPIEIRDGFPIAETPGDFRVRKELRELLAFTGYLTRIEELQPFNEWNESIWGLGPFGGSLKPILTVPEALRRLARLNNIDKHRTLHPAWIGGTLDFRTVIAAIPRDLMIGDPNQSGGGLVSSQGEIGPHVDGAQVGSLYFRTPLPYVWEPSEVDMNRYFALKVSFADARVFEGVLEQLSFCIWGVESVLNIFDPVFTHGDPPLPVTASLPKRKRS
jgi:hypothetical protein